MTSMLALGDVANFVPEASGVHLDMTDYGSITFVSFVATGDNTLTLRESIDGASEQLLAAIDLIHKAPGVGGTWTEVTQTAGSAFTNADATNDSFAITILSTDLSDGFNSLEATVDAGTCFAFLGHLRDRRNPTRLPTPIAS